MVVHIAPIGEHTEHVIEWIREVTPVTKIYLIHSKKTSETNFAKKARDLEKKDQRRLCRRGDNQDNNRKSLEP